MLASKLCALLAIWLACVGAASWAIGLGWHQIGTKKAVAARRLGAAHRGIVGNFRQLPGHQ